MQVLCGLLEPDCTAIGTTHSIAGCAAFIPTVVTASQEVYSTVLPRLSPLSTPFSSSLDSLLHCRLGALLDENEFARQLPGLHLEGPFISPEPGAVGAHNARCKEPN